MEPDEIRAGRALCVWIGCLATWRQGLVQRLVRDTGSMRALLRLSPEAIAARATPARSGRRPRAAVRSGVAPFEGSIADEAARPIDRLLAEGPEACLERVGRCPKGGRIVTWLDAAYPDQLRKLADPPLCLFVQGVTDLAVEQRLEALASVPAVAVVGTRGPSVYGEEMARLLGADLTRAGLIVVSGMALGVDATAQAAAIAAHHDGRRPGTVAVLGCGADVVYPRTHAALYREVLEQGLVLSEFAWGTPARPWRFPARNRLMAALCRAVVLVEGTMRSGGRITVGYALDLGKEVLCVPGEAGRRLSEAPHLFLRDGAKLCESAADVLKAIAVDADPASGEAPAGAAEGPVVVLDHGAGVVRRVLLALDDGPLTVDQAAARCAVGSAEAAATLGSLELDGLARRLDGGAYRRVGVRTRAGVGGAATRPAGRKGARER